MKDPLKSRYRPVVAIDIDGVLRLAVPPEGPGPADAFKVELTVHRNAYPRIYHKAPRWDRDGTATRTYWLSGTGARWIRSLLSRDIEVVWATTWQSFANVYFAPLLNIPPLPVGTEGTYEQQYTSSEWKTSELAYRYPGRPLVWVDDSPVHLDAYELQALRSPRDRALTLSWWIKDPRRGITTNDIAGVEAWLELAFTPDGHDALRRQRRNEQAAQRRRRALSRHGTLERARRWRGAFKFLSQLNGGSPPRFASYVADYLRDTAEVDADQVRALIKYWWQRGDPEVDVVVAAIIRWSRTESTEEAN